MFHIFFAGHRRCLGFCRKWPEMRKCSIGPLGPGRSKRSFRQASVPGRPRFGPGFPGVSSTNGVQPPDLWVKIRVGWGQERTKDPSPLILTFSLQGRRKGARIRGQEMISGVSGPESAVLGPWLISGPSSENQVSAFQRFSFSSWDGSRDALGRVLGRIKPRFRPMFTGRGTVARVTGGDVWGGAYRKT